MNEKGHIAPQVLVTGRHWLGADGARPIGNVLIDLISSARQEVIIVAYRLTVAVPEFIEVLEAALGRGCYVRIVRDNSGEPNAAEEGHLSKLLNQFKNLSVWDFRDERSGQINVALHAKMIIVDRKFAVVGSANFSRNGMLENHEIAIRLAGKEVSSLGAACDKLIESGQREGVLTQRRPNGP